MTDFRDINLSDQPPVDDDECSIVEEEQKIPHFHKPNVKLAQPQSGRAEIDASGESVLGIIADVEAQLSRIRKAQAEKQEELKTLEQRAYALCQAEDELRQSQETLAARTRELNMLEAELSDLRESVERRELDLETKANSLTSREGDLAQMERDLVALRETCATERASLKEAKETFDRIALEIEDSRKDVEQRQALADQHEQTLFDREQKLNEQAAVLEQLQKECEEREKEVAAARKTIDDGRALLDEHWSDFNTERASLSALAEELEAREAACNIEAEQLRAQLSQAEEALTLAHSEQKENAKSQAELLTRVERAERNVGDLLQQVEKLNQALEQAETALTAAQNETLALRSERDALQDELKQSVAQHQQQAAAFTQQLEEMQQELTAARKRIAALKAESAETATRATALATANQEQAEAYAQLKEVSNAFEKDAEDAQARANELEASLTSQMEACATTERDRDEAQRLAEEQAQQLAQHIADEKEFESIIADRERVIAEQKRTLEAAKQKLSEFAAAIGEQTTQVQAGVEAMATVREQKAQLERLKEQLASAKMAADPEELARKNERIAELTEALHQARGQSTGAGDVSERDARIAELNQELDSLRSQVEHWRLEAADALSALESVREQSGSRDHARQAGLENRIRELEATIAGLEANQSNESAKPALPTEIEAAKRDLEHKASRLRAAVEHLRRRRRRLLRAKQLVHERARAIAEAQPNARSKSGPAPATLLSHDGSHERYQQAMQTDAKVQQQRQVLSDATRCLAQSERAMIKRWARPRAIVTMMWLLVLSALVAGGSWLAADHFFPATIAASATLQAQPKPNSQLTDAEREQWLNWHRDRLFDEAFIRSLAKRMDDRRLSDLTEPVLLRKHLEEFLTTDSTQPGELTVIYQGEEPALTKSVLDGIILTLQSDSRRMVGQRTESARTRVLTERTVDGTPRFAVLNSAPLHDERLRYAGIIFGIAMTVSMLIIGVIYTRLAKARRVFDEIEILDRVTASSTG
ncbi:MAG: hypothetical protein ACR2GY_10910 [Phycisphaerales bacterium]